MANLETGDRGLSRRDLIRGAAVAGVGAWTAPIIIESLTSPAAAQSCANPYFVGAGALGHGTVSPITAVLPGGVQANDLILVVTSYRSDAEGVPAAPGYTKITGLVNSTVPAPRIRTDVLYKVAGAGEASPAVTFSSIGNGAIVAAFVYRCINPAAPFDTTTLASLGRTTGSGTTFPAPTYTTTVTAANVLVVNVVSGASSLGATTSTGGFNVEASGSGYASTDGPQFIGVADIVKVTSGAQAGSSWTTTTATNWVGLSFALQL